MVQAEVVRCIVHQSHQLFAFIDDGAADAPGKYGCKKTGYLYILLFGK